MSDGRDDATGWGGKGDSDPRAEAGMDYPARASVRLGAIEPPSLSFSTESEAWVVGGEGVRTAQSKAAARAAAASSSSSSAAEPGAIGRAAVMGVDVIPTAAAVAERNAFGGGYNHRSVAFEVMEEEEIQRVGGRRTAGGGFFGLLGRIAGMFSKVASSGVEENYLYEALAPGLTDELETGYEGNGDSIAGQGDRPGLVPGMAGGKLRGQVIRPGRGVHALVGQEMSNGR